MVLQSDRPVWTETRIVPHRFHRQALIDGLVELGGVRDVTDGFRPMKGRASDSDNAFIVHHAVGGRVKPEQADIYQDPTSLRDLFRYKLHHPGESDIRKPRLVFWIASADVCVVAGEPDLIELFGLVLPVGPLHRPAPSPRHPLEV